MISLNIFEIILFLAHFAQFVTYLVIPLLPSLRTSNVPVTITVLNEAPGANLTTYDTMVLFNANLVAMVSVIAGLSSIFHLSHVFWRGSKKDDSVGLFGSRWIENCFTYPIMIWVAALVSGLTDLYALGAIGACMVGVNMLFSSSEKSAQEEKWRPFYFAALVGLIVWVIILAQVVLLGVRLGASAIPYQLAISLSQFVLFFSLIVVEYINVSKFDTFKVLKGIVAEKRTKRSGENEKLLPKDENMKRSKESTAIWFLLLLDAVQKVCLAALTTAALVGPA